MADKITTWVECPVCGEPDMRKTIVDGGAEIDCTNLECASNGGSNWSALRKRHGIPTLNADEVISKLGEFEVTCCLAGMHRETPSSLEMERNQLHRMIRAMELRHQVLMGLVNPFKALCDFKQDETGFYCISDLEALQDEGRARLADLMLSMGLNPEAINEL